jgi:hypothetical protein
MEPALRSPIKRGTVAFSISIAQVYPGSGFCLPAREIYPGIVALIDFCVDLSCRIVIPFVATLILRDLLSPFSSLKGQINRLIGWSGGTITARRAGDRSESFPP